MLKASNLALKFVLEIGAFAALGYWGATTGRGVVPVVLAIATPAAAIALWAVFAAPKSDRRLAAAARVPFELTVFALAALALLYAGRPTLALVFAAVAAVNAALLAAWDQFEY